MRQDLISINDLTNEGILEIFEIADEFMADPRSHRDLCQANIMASLFYEPSTRTRLSFEAAMHRLGGDVVSCANMQDSSTAKGESLADSVRVIGGNYADIVVLRHPSEGAARVAAAYSSVPVINAGDGGHEHPTQTLCDLYILMKEKKSLSGLDVAICGDLKYSRTVHSLAYALARFGANILCIPGEGLEMPEHVVERLSREFHSVPSHHSGPEFQSLVDQVDAVYITPNQPHQLSLFTELDSEQNRHKVIRKIDALYLTRAQTERFRSTEDPRRAYPRVDQQVLASPKFREALVMHPLPRRGELPYEVDRDPRSVYFKQAQVGVPIRMALIAILLGKRKLDPAARAVAATQAGDRVRLADRACLNVSCISRTEEGAYITPEFLVTSDGPSRLRCVYCEVDQDVAEGMWNRGEAREEAGV